MTEAQHEFKSVEYAVLCSEPKLPQPLLILSGGSGSVQVTAFDAFFSFNAACSRPDSTPRLMPGPRAPASC